MAVGDGAPLKSFWHSFPLEFKLLAATALFQQMAVTAYHPLVPQVAVDLGLGGGTLGVIYSVSAAIPLAIALPAGAAIDKLGVRRILLVGMLARATGMLLLWLHPSFLMLGLSLVLTAASFSLVEVSMQTFVSAIGDEDQVGRNLGWFTFVMSLGMVLGPYLGGVVADSYGYGTAFLGAGITAGITIPVLLFLREQRSQSELAAEQTSWLNAIKRLAANRGLLTGVLVVTFLYFNLGAWRIYLPAYLRTLNFSPGHIGQVVSAFTLTAMLARPLFSRAARLLGRRTLAAVSLTVAAIGLLSIPLSSVRWLLIIIAAVVGTGRGLIPILSIVLISDHTEEHNRGLALSFRMLTIRAGSSINPLLFGAAASLGGMTAPFFLAGTLALVAAAAVQALPFFEFSSDTPSSTAGTSYRSPGQ